MNKKLLALAACACLGLSLYAESPFSPDIQRRFLGRDPIARRQAAQEALAKYGSQPLKLVTYLGMTPEQLKQIVAGQEIKQVAGKPKLQEAAPLIIEDTEAQVLLDVNKRARQMPEIHEQVRIEAQAKT